MRDINKVIKTLSKVHSNPVFLSITKNQLVQEVVPFS